MLQIYIYVYIYIYIYIYIWYCSEGSFLTSAKSIGYKNTPVGVGEH